MRFLPSFRRGSSSGTPDGDTPAEDTENVEQVVVQLDAEQLRALSTVFSAPRWLRDLGIAAWFLVGVGVLLVGLTWVFGVTSTITEPVVAAGVVAMVASPGVTYLQRYHVARASRRADRAARARGDRRSDPAARARRDRRPGRRDLEVREGGSRQDPGLDGGRRRRHVRRLERELECLGGHLRHDLDARQGRRVRHPRPRLSRVRHLADPVLHLLPAQGRAGPPRLGEPSPGRAARGRRTRSPAASSSRCAATSSA